MIALLRSRRGITLLNLILLLMLVGVVTTAGVKMMGPLVQRGKITSTKTTLDSVVAAISSWSLSRGHLPGTAAEFAEASSNQYDAWGHRLRYLYDKGLISTSNVNTICSYTSTGLTVNSAANVAFAVLSLGDDFVAQSSWNGTAFSSDEAKYLYPLHDGLNGTTNNAAVLSPDVFRLVTLDELKARIGCFGKTGGRLAIVNNELPGACSNQPYTAMLYANGGVPFTGANSGYNWTITGRPPGMTPTTYDSPSWSTTPAQSLTLGGTAPSAPGSYPITFSVQDNQQPAANTAQRTYNLTVAALVTPSVTGSNGTITPTTPLCVKQGNTTSFTITPSTSSYSPSVAGTCGGTLSGSGTAYTFTTLPVYNNCTVTVSFSGSSDPAQQFREYIQSENVFVYGTTFTFDGNSVSGVNATTVINGNLTTGNLNGGASVAVSYIYINGSVDLDGGSASLGSSIAPGHIYVNGNMSVWSGTRNIYGTVHVNGNFRLKDAKMHGDVYVNGNVELGWTPTIDKNIYYTGTLTYPNSYPAALLAKCIKVDATALPTFQMPSYTIPAPRDNTWYASKGYVNAGLASGRKIFTQSSFSSTSWMSSVSNVIIVSKGDITITGLGGSGLTGVLFAPYGKVTFDGGFFEGLVIARDGFYVTSGGTPITFKNISTYISSTDDYPF